MCYCIEQFVDIEEKKTIQQNKKKINEYLVINDNKLRILNK